MFMDLVVVITLKRSAGFCAFVLHFSLVEFNYVPLSGLIFEADDRMWEKYNLMAHYVSINETGFH